VTGLRSFKVRFITTISLLVEAESDDEGDAAERAWEYAEGYLQTLTGDGGHVLSVDASLDGIGGDVE
jgi:hypothetical protein